MCPQNSSIRVDEMCVDGDPAHGFSSESENSDMSSELSNLGLLSHISSVRCDLYVTIQKSILLLLIGLSKLHLT